MINKYSKCIVRLLLMREVVLLLYWEGMDAKKLIDFHFDKADHQKRDCAGDQFWDVDEGAHLVLVLEVLSSIKIPSRI